ncbi:MAG: hypothetical protein HY673_02640 [Chloroflexi bacterium]|nr:hypothetical protein [Chloroflexota bacterium]
MFANGTFHKWIYLAVALLMVASVTAFGAPAEAQQAMPGVGRGFTATIDTATYAPEPGKPQTTISLKADQVAGKTMQLQGDFVAMDVDLDTLTISAFAVEGTMVYAMVVPQHGSILSDDLIIRFEGEKVFVERKGPNGLMRFKAEDGNDGGLLEWTPEPRQPEVMNVEYTLGPGLRYTGLLLSITGEQQLHFAGLKQGFESSSAAPDHPELARPVFWTPMSSLWSVSRMSKVETELDGPFGTGAFVAFIDGVAYKAKKAGDRTTFKLKAARVAGKTMQVVGLYNTMSISLDTFAVTNFSVDGVILYQSMAPQQNAILTGDLLMEFDKEKIRLERPGAAGLMKFRASDTNFLKIIEWSPNPAPPNRMDIVFTLGAGISYTGTDPVGPGQVRLLFSGMGKTGWEISRPTPGDPELANLTSWTPTSSIWSVSAASSVNTELPLP